VSLYKDIAIIYATESGVPGDPIVFIVKATSKTKGVLGKYADSEYILPRNSIYRVDKIESSETGGRREWNQKLIHYIRVTHLGQK
jgi:hypothetical protein